MIDQLIAIDQQRSDLVTDKKNEYEDKLSEWQSVNTMLLSLKTSASSLSSEDAFNEFTTSTTSNTSTAASDILTIASASTASAGTYNIMVDNVAQSEKISSRNYTASDTVLSLSGDILISGTVVNIASTDTLANIKDKINALNTGTSPSCVTASIVQHSPTDYRLVLTSDDTGEDGISILEGSLDNVLQTMGFITSSTAIKTTTSDGAKSDLFNSSTGIVGTLLELSSPSGDMTVQIGGTNVDINLSTQSITTIAQNIDALAGISASVVSETEDGETHYRIDISGTTSFTDNGNVLQTLGILKGTYGTVNEMHAGDAAYATGTGAAITNTTTWANIFTGALRGTAQNTELPGLGGGYLSATTKWNEIDTGSGANDIDNGDSITVAGTDHNGVAVNQTYTITDNGEDLSNFLSQLETWFGGSSTIDAYFDSTGRLIVEDLQSGSSQLGVTLTPVGTTLDIGTFGTNITDSDTITISGTNHDGTAVTTTNFTISSTSDALNKATTGFLATIESLYGGSSVVDAYISDGTDGNTAGQIILKDLQAGDSQISLDLIVNNEGGGTLNFGDISVATEGRSMQLAAGEDAQITVDNVIFTKSSNTITDIIEGITLNLVGESDTTTVTMKIERDVSAVKSTIQGFVNSFNTIMEYINTQFSYDDDEEETGGILFGDGTLSSVKSDLINIATQTITGLSGDYNRLPLIGISLDDEVNLTIDDDDLTDALETNFDQVKKMFIASGSGTSSLFQYVGHTDDTDGGGYAVNITQEATQTTVTGSTTLAGTLTADETITIKDYATGREATVSLITGMNIDAVVNAINSEFAEENTEQLSGSNNTGYTSSTLWSAIGGADNGDAITFSGTKRSGVSLSGSYTVDTTKSLGYLLQEIEDSFDDEVTATLDENGKLLITDKQTGDSNLTFTIDTSTVSGLDFGTVTATTEGRHTIPITASKTAGNELLLTHNTYGTGHIIVVSESGGTELGLNSATQVYGQNVAGTINGATATGSGQMLTLDGDGNNANGLSILYTGTSTTNTTFTLTLGIAELMNRQLGFITDSSDGYVAYKKTSLENSIESYETRLEQMEATLNRKMEMMINKFVAMEMALSKIQNQSDWLTGQITASYSGWG